MKDVTPIYDEADIPFGMIWILFNCYLYNSRDSFPDAIIYLVLADIKACFHFPKIRPDLTGAFGFLVNGIYCLAIAMVFGSNVSASSWEAFHRVIERLSISFAKCPREIVTSCSQKFV